MKIALDMDGVIYEFNRTMRYMLRTYRGCTGLEQYGDEWLLPDQDWHNVTKEDWEWLFKEGIELGLFRYGHMTKGARVGLEALHADGHSLQIVTNRPQWASEDTFAWIALYFKGIPLTGVTILDGSKRFTKADLLIDDKPEHVLDWGAGRNAILFDQPWNRHLVLQGWEKIRRANGWADVVQIMREEKV